MPSPLQDTDALVSLGRSSDPDARWWAMERLVIQAPDRVDAWPLATVNVPNALEVCRSTAGESPDLALTGSLVLLRAGLLPEDPSAYLASLRATVDVAPAFAWELLIKLGAVERADLRAIQGCFGENDPLFWAALLRCAGTDAERETIAGAIAAALPKLGPDAAAAHIDEVVCALGVPGLDVLGDTIAAGPDSPENRMEVGVARAEGRPATHRRGAAGSPSTAVLRLVQRHLRDLPHPAAAFLRGCAAQRDLAGPLGYLLPIVGWLGAFREGETPTERLQGVLERGDALDFYRVGEARRGLLSQPGGPRMPANTNLWDVALNGPECDAVAKRLLTREVNDPQAPQLDWLVIAPRRPELALAAIAGDFTRSKAALAGMLPWEEALEALLAWAPDAPGDQDWLAICLLRAGEQAAVSRVETLYAEREPPEPVAEAFAVAAAVLGIR